MKKARHGGDESESRQAEPQPRHRFSESLAVGLGLLELFSSETPRLGIMDLSRRSGLSKPSAHRYASTAAALGYLQQNRSRKYVLAPKAANPGLSAITTFRRSLQAQRALEELREKTGYTVSLGALDRNAVTYVYRLFGHRRGQHLADLELHAGARVPLYCTALGKALLAGHTEEARREIVFAIDVIPYGPRSIRTHQELLADVAKLNSRRPVISDEELVEGARSIAMYVPRLHVEHAIGIEVTVPAASLTVAQLRKRIGPKIVHAAKLISQAPDQRTLE